MFVLIRVIYWPAFVRVGGFENMQYLYFRAVPNTTLYSNSTCGVPRDDAMHLFRHHVTGDIPWPGLIGITVNSIWYWCADQVGDAKSYTHGGKNRFKNWLGFSIKSQKAKRQVPAPRLYIVTRCDPWNYGYIGLV